MCVCIRVCVCMACRFAAGKIQGIVAKEQSSSHQNNIIGCTCMFTTLESNFESIPAW